MDAWRGALMLMNQESSCFCGLGRSSCLGSKPSCMIAPMTHRHWPVVVMGVSDLPGSIAGGACALQPGSSFPLSLADVSAKHRAEEAYPVLVLGTQVSIAGELCCSTDVLRSLHMQSYQCKHVAALGIWRHAFHEAGGKSASHKSIRRTTASAGPMPFF